LLRNLFTTIIPFFNLEKDKEKPPGNSGGGDAETRRRLF
jgi:hypothetical protein